MDQTTKAALSETEKCLNNTTQQNSDSESDIEEQPATDALLGGIRCGLSTITRTARQALSTCKTKSELDDASEKIEKSTLDLLRLEKSFLKTASIVADVVDELAPQFEDEEEALLATGEDDSVDKAGAGDATANPEPYIFRLSEKNLESVVIFKERLAKEYHERFAQYKNGLTEGELKEDSKFLALMTQLNLGRNDAEMAMAKASDTNNDLSDSQDDNNSSDLDGLHFHIPFSAEELKAHKYKPYNEAHEKDDFGLPTVDPITKLLIVSPVRNKYCNHVFDRRSINHYILQNPNAKCPMDLCRNLRPLEQSHFVEDPVLTARVRRKNLESS